MPESALPTVRVMRDAPSETWDAYVAGRPDAAPYHRSRWPRTLAGIFGLQSFYLEAVDDRDSMVGVLPLIRQRSLIFGDRLVSLPFVNYGGVLADNDPVRRALMAQACELGRSIGVDQVELRDTVPPPSGWSCRRDKTSLQLALPGTIDELQKTLGSKLRSQVKRAARDPHEVLTGGIDLLDDFYPVFAMVMHQLGTPVYPRRFFAEILRRVPDECTIVSIRRNSRSVAAAFLIGACGTLEVPWAATIADEKPRGTNMLLYAEVLKLAVQRGYGKFDFGRSTVDSGPYRFKLQWGAQPVQLHWAVWPGTSETSHETSSSRSAATRLWARLPLTVANRLGPLISPSLPW